MRARLCVEGEWSRGGGGGRDNPGSPVNWDEPERVRTKTAMRWVTADSQFHHSRDSSPQVHRSGKRREASNLHKRATGA